MKEYTLSYGKITLLREDIAEVIINEGVEMNIGIVRDYHEFLLSHLSAPFSLLVNKVNAYSYDGDAQESIATLKEIKAMAVVAYNHVTWMTTEGLLDFPRNIKWNIKIFSSRAAALSWVILEQEKN